MIMIGEIAYKAKTHATKHAEYKRREISISQRKETEKKDLDLSSGKAPVTPTVESDVQDVDMQVEEEDFFSAPPQPPLPPIPTTTSPTAVQSPTLHVVSPSHMSSYSPSVEQKAIDKHNVRNMRMIDAMYRFLSKGISISTTACRFRRTFLFRMTSLLS